MTYETTICRVQEIVRILTNGTPPLSESLALYEEGVGLLRAADATLTDMERRAKELMSDPEADTGE